MKKYVVYSGKNGYGLHEAHPDFPKEYEKDIKDLYTEQQIAVIGDSSSDKRCYRYTPFKDGFLFSVIYKGCSCKEEPRSFISAINWFLSTEEANDLWSGKIAQKFFSLVAQSDNILSEAGYSIPEVVLPDLNNEEIIEGDVFEALISSVYYSAKSYENKELYKQAFVGCDNLSEMFNRLLFVIRMLPVGMRKLLSFHIGAGVSTEIRGVSLALTYNKILSDGKGSGSFDNATGVEKIYCINGSIASGSEIPTVASYYAALNNEDIKYLKNLFRYSESFIGYLRYVIKFAKQDENANLGAEFIKAAGEDAFLINYKNGMFPHEQLMQMYSDRELFLDMPQAVAVLCEYAKPFIEEGTEQEALKSEAEKEALPELKEAEHKSKKTRKKQNRTENKRKGGRLASAIKWIVKVHNWLWPYIRLLLCIALIVASAVLSYIFGIKVIASLHEVWAHLLYAVQIGFIFLIDMPLCGLLIYCIRVICGEKNSDGEEESR